ncbi:MAG TPA: metallophosphoesterase [Terriglobales bacterium]|nr:metallophosphoesterase [Terriglobales bacterium]
MNPKPGARRLRSSVPRRTEFRQNSWRQVQTLLYARRRAARDPEINHLQLQLPHLPPALEGLRIAHLSDIHYGLFLSSRSLSRILDLTQAQRPDLIAITGDFVTQSPAFVEPVSEMLARLRAPLGVWAVLGNHDFRSGAERVTRALRQQGIKVLRNQRRLLRHGATRFQIAGIDDSRQHPDVAAALGGRGRAPEAPFTLLLAHNPLELEPAARCGVDLVLSGHTHGGQIKLGFAAQLYERYLPAGLLTSGETQMYVSRGLGKVIVPMRVGAPPELAFLTLHRGVELAPPLPASR